MTLSLPRQCLYIRQNPWQQVAAIPCHLANPADLAIARFGTFIYIVTAGFGGKIG
jgi:hypothetical protein